MDATRLDITQHRSRSVRPDIPSPGFYAMRLVKGGIEVPVMIWHGSPVIAGEWQDRCPRWCVAIDGKSCRWDKDQQCRVPLDVFDAWPACSGHRNGEAAAARYKKRAYSADGLQKLREMNTRRAQERIERIVATLADILRANAHAPMVKLVALMNATDVRPNPRGQPWSEQSLARHLDAALARVTDPNGPQVSG